MTAAPEAPPTPSLRVEGLEIRKGGRPVVSGIELRQQPGSVLWVVGSNGAGKSSLLRCMAGLERPHAGRVVLAGGRGRVLYEPDMRLPPEASAGAWLRLSSRLTRSGRASDGVPGAGAAPAAGIRAPWISPARRIGALSTGEEKRLILETLLSSEADFVFLDEPFSHLSSDGRSALRELLERRRDRSVVVVATNRPPPRAAVDRVLALGGAR